MISLDDMDNISFTVISPKHQNYRGKISFDLSNIQELMSVRNA